METKILIIGNIIKGDSILLRKKFSGSEPYQETWYSFGAEFFPGEAPSETFKRYVKDFIGVDVAPARNFFWDTEQKNDHDGVTKHFIYLDLECEYVSGEPILPKGHERIAWIPIEKLSDFDIVPPSVVLFKKLGYLK